ncbi:MAG TPA: isoleucine--tRNA ligase [Candidatus Moranbacteria bacterium]|nr:MAG: Isoleucine-tRNA ligase [Candidatus Moranbacteria bacterium GW2011_GWC2_45_10]KKT94292.1 MAG: Isoleucine-tRNA ligase [Parcubacteria group bacterium GW2011_GWC1_45_14]HAV11606.1 isoleucine--tRNA ligase [Candidatus Moranbacteria bacterium]
MFKKIDPKQTFPKMEEEVLKFWNEEKIFEKSLEKRKDAKRYSFYDGPPFATGTPHYGHLVSSTMKDVVPRFWTMKGFYVERKWGWDCHGLPIENIVEKELGSKTKKDIEKLGVEKFNELCRSKVLGYVEEWKKVIGRLGRWADMENSYKTMDLSYMESIWWVFKQLWDKGLIYEGYRAMHICPRCETTLSQSEVAEGYLMVKDLSAVAKFELLSTNYESDTNVRITNKKEKDVKTYVLAWTTTPWTLIGNVALAVGEYIDYVLVQTTRVDKEKGFVDEKLILAKDKLEEVMKEKEYEILKHVKGSSLVGKKYKPLFPYYQEKEIENKINGWKIYAADFVTTAEGTGVVHIAPAFGEDDMNLGKRMALPFVQHIGMDGIIKEEATDFAGLHVKPLGDHQSTDVEIIRYLAKHGALFSKEKYEHSYPHCWRCDTPLLNYATSSWFVDVLKMKARALETAKQISWVPAHMKEGRFGKWLEGARDWSISRQRFWASVIPIWRCECGEMKVFGSVAELEEISGEKITDIHKHIVDKIVFKCEKCGKDMKRVPDVLDTWFDSGSMPYAQQHYPFENKEKFEGSFPAQFIAEGQDQTRAWFYYLHMISTTVRDSHAFENVIVNGTVQAEDGKKMSKRLQNYPDPQLMFDKYGADAMRLYLMSSPVVFAQNINFSEKDVAEFVRGTLRMLWNSYSFFVLYANIDGFDPKKDFGKSENILDRWMLSELNTLIKEVNEGMEQYDLARTARLFPKFVDNLSNWFIRRSRKRFWKSENDSDKDNAYATLHEVMVKLSQLMAPFAPFISDEIYKNLTGEESVHLSDFPEFEAAMIDDNLNREMAEVRNLISLGLQMRATAKIKVRQPLSAVKIKIPIESQELQEIIKDELNVKEVVIEKGLAEEVELNTEISEELRMEGMAREVVRFIQEMRKEAGFEVDNRIKIWYNGTSEVFSKFGELISKETLADGLNEGKSEDFDLEKEFDIDGGKIVIQIKR